MSVLADEPVVKLTPRQAQFLALFAAGKTWNEIGAACYVSRWTVRDTLLNAQERLAASSVRQTVVKAIALGILVPLSDGSVEVVALIVDSS